MDEAGSSFARRAPSRSCGSWWKEMIRTWSRATRMSSPTWFGHRRRARSRKRDATPPSRRARPKSLLNTPCLARGSCEVALPGRISPPPRPRYPSLDCAGLLRPSRERRWWDMRRPMVAGNWKMHGSGRVIRRLRGGKLCSRGGDAECSRRLVYLAEAARPVAGARRDHCVGQDVHVESAGAFTGEVAAEMVADLGVRHALVGHSERRQLSRRGPTAWWRRKHAAARRAGLTPIRMCRRDARGTRRGTRRGRGARAARCGVRRGPPPSTRSSPTSRSGRLGLGETATAEQAQGMHAAIREAIAP